MNRRPIRKQRLQNQRDDLSNETRPFIGRHLAVPFILFAFHAHRTSQGARHDLA